MVKVVKGRIRVLACFLLVFLLPLSVRSSDWPMYMHDPAHTGYAPDMPDTFAPPLVLRWISNVSDPLVNGTWLGHPSARGGRLFFEVNVKRSNFDMGEYILALDAGTGEMENTKHLSRQVFPPIFIPSQNNPLVLDDRVIWGIPYSTGGLAALPLEFSEDTGLLFNNAGPQSPKWVRFSSPVESSGLVIAGEFGSCGYVAKKNCDRHCEIKNGTYKL